jgi:hypothetical protein
MLGASLVLAAALAATAQAESPAPASPDAGAAAAGSAPDPAGSAADSDRLSPRRLLSGPSLYETGRIGTAPQAKSAIEPQEQLDLGHEKSVDREAASTAAPVPRSGEINQAVLDHQIDARFGVLDNCRLDVARTKSVPPTDIVASTLTLRWTIRPNGSTADTVVVASSPADPEVMSCVKAAMRGWKFVAPRGGSVQVERAFTFKPLPPSSGL